MGSDTVDYSANTSAGVTVDLVGGTASSTESGDDTLVSIENIVGTQFADILIGDGGNNTITGLDGNDTLTGNAGNDTYVFTDGWSSDTITDSAGFDSLDLTGVTSDLTFAIGLSDLYVFDADNEIIDAAFAIENLYSGSGDDLFVFADGAQIDGRVDGGAGTDTLDYRAASDSIAVTLEDLGSQDGYAGADAMVPSGFDNINILLGSAYDNTLTGLSHDSHWTVAGVTNFYQADDSLEILTFSGFDWLIGSNGDDVFTIQSGSQSVLIWAGDGDDTLVMEAGAELDGFFDGQAGLDTLDYSGFDQARSFSLLPALGETDGFDIRVDSITADALNMEQILGTALNDELIGRDALATLNIYNGLDNYVDETSGRVLYFDAIEDLYGGSQVDTFNMYSDHSGNLHGMGGDDVFTFSFTAQLNGYLDGGAGSNSLDYSDYDSARSFDLTGFGSQSGYDGTEASISLEFRNISSITGHSSAGHDSLQGLDADGVWMVDGVGSGNYLPQGALSALAIALIEDLIGEDGLDTFSFIEGGQLNGDISGGAGANVLDYSGMTSAINVILTGYDALAGFNGTESNILGGSFSGIHELLGGSGSDSLYTLDADSSFHIDQANGGSYHVGEAVLLFSDMDNLIAGSGADGFYMEGSGSVGGILDGGAGSDWLDYTSYDSSVTVNLTSGLASGTGSLAHIENLAGSAFDDSLTGDGADNRIEGNNGNDILNGMGGDDTLVGGLGDDRYVFNDNWGVDLVMENSGAGSDTISLENVTSGSTFRFDLSGGLTIATILNGANQVLQDLYQVENFTGGSGDDTFTFGKGTVLSGLIDGHLGSDTLNYAERKVAVKVTLTGIGTLDGFKGTETSLGSFDNINAIVGGFVADTLTGHNADTLFHIEDGNLFLQDVASGRVLAFSSFETLSGGSADDTFAMIGSVVFNGKLIGGAGSDTIDYSVYTTSITVNLASGSATGVTGGISSIENLIGSPVGNVIYGDDNDNILIGTSGNDTIYGKGGNDTLIGLGGNDILDGGTGIDTVDYHLNTDGVTVTLTSTGGTAVSGSGGTDTLVSIENVIGSAFDDVITGNAGDNRIEGGAGSDTLNGGTGNDTYAFADGWGTDTVTDLSGVDSYDFSAATNALTFTVSGSQISVSAAGGSLTTLSGSIERFIGGTNDDIFILKKDASFALSVDGQDGDNHFDLSDFNFAVEIDLLSTGSLSGFNGIVIGSWNIAFANISRITAGSTLSDTLTGLDADATWQLDDSSILYSALGRGLTFSGVENLLGGDGDDTFAFVNHGTLAGSLDGGAGTNSLDYSGYSATVSVNLSDSSATAIGGTFANINTFSGSAASDTLSTPNSASTITIDGANSGTVNAIYEFSSFENLLAGSGDDSIAFVGDGSLSGGLQGGAGTDTLDFSAYGRGVTVNLNTNSADVLGGSLGGIENLIGSAYADDLTGSSVANRIEGGAGDDSLSGLGGDDSYIFRDGSGMDVVFEDIGGGSDTLIFISDTRGVEFHFYADRVEISGGTDKVTHTGSNVEIFTGTQLDDRFVLEAGAAMGSTKLDGGLGDDSLDYSAYGSARQVTLSGFGQPGWLCGQRSGRGQLR